MEGLEFRGSVSFKGVGGSPTVDAGQAKGRLYRTSELRCRPGGGEESRTGAGFFDSHHAAGNLSTFRAEALERLAGPVAVDRVIEVTGAPSHDFKVGSKAEHPKSAIVRPPMPFAGSAAYRSTGSIGSSASGKMTGSLSVDLFGVKVRLAGARAKASLINLNPGY